MPKDHGIGASTKRREDVRFLTGAGNYTDDINIHGQAYVHFLRSDVAHGTITTLDTAAAAAMPGVVQVFTGADFEGVGGLPCGWQVTDKHGEPMQEPGHPILATGKVRHVGEIVRRWWPRASSRRATRPRRSSSTSRSCRRSST